MSIMITNTPATLLGPNIVQFHKLNIYRWLKNIYNYNKDYKKKQLNLVPKT